MLDLFGGAGGRGICWDEALAGTELGRTTSTGGDVAICGRAIAGERTGTGPYVVCPCEFGRCIGGGGSACGCCCCCAIRRGLFSTSVICEGAILICGGGTDCWL